jgi:hypothetical protein
MQFSSKRVNHAERCEIRIAQIPSVFKELAIVFIPRPRPEPGLGRGRPRAHVPRLRQIPDPHSESPLGSGQRASQGRNPSRPGKNPSYPQDPASALKPTLPQRGRVEKQKRPDQARFKPGSSQEQARSNPGASQVQPRMLPLLCTTPGVPLYHPYKGSPAPAVPFLQFRA